jgi:zinc transport system substrate-binding protein
MKKKHLILITITMISLLTILTLQKNKTDEVPIITTSIYPYQYIAQTLLGNQFKINNIVPTGQEPHDYEPTAKDIELLSQSKLLIINGLDLEPWYNKIQKNIKVPVVVATNSVETKDNDPHIWLSPKRYIKVADKLATEVKKYNLADHTIVDNNLQKLKNNINQLDTQYANKLKPNNCKYQKFVTSHSAFNYLAQDYNLEAVSIAGLDPESEPSTQDIIRVINVIKNTGIKTILTEPLVNNKTIDTISIQTNTQKLILNPLEGLTEDESKSNQNYISIMQENLKNLAIAMECK